MLKIPMTASPSVITMLPAPECVENTLLLFSSSIPQCLGEELEAERSHLTTAAYPKQKQLSKQLKAQC